MKAWYLLLVLALAAPVTADLRARREGAHPAES